MKVNTVILSIGLVLLSLGATAQAQGTAMDLLAFVPMEAEVASRIVKGMDLAEICDDLGITIHTVRGHLKRLFAKTGTHRQPDLIRVLLTGLAGFRLE